MKRISRKSNWVKNYTIWGEIEKKETHNRKCMWSFSGKRARERNKNCQCNRKCVHFQSWKRENSIHVFALLLCVCSSSFFLSSHQHSLSLFGYCWCCWCCCWFLIFSCFVFHFLFSCRCIQQIITKLLFSLSLCYSLETSEQCIEALPRDVSFFTSRICVVDRYIYDIYVHIYADVKL